MTSNNTHVLVVGIDHYSRAAGADLRGCRNDAISWWRLCVAHLGVPPEQITVLTSPPMTVGELAGSPALGEAAERTRRGEADRATIMNAFGSLATRVRDDEAAAGLFAFSGHGKALGDPEVAVAGDNLAMCPQDIDPADDATAIPLVSLEQLLEGHVAGPRVTMVIDACYTGRRGRHFDRGVPGKRTRKTAAARFGLGDQCRLITGAAIWETAHEIAIEGRWHGACTWVMTRLLQRWKRYHQAGVNYVNVSYHELIHRVVSALGVFGVDQVPVLWGPRSVDDQAFLHVGGQLMPGSTSRVPDAEEGGRQLPITPGKAMLWAISVDDEPFMYVAVAGDAPESEVALQFASGAEVLEPNQEKWWLVTTATPPSSEATIMLEAVVPPVDFVDFGDECASTTEAVSVGSAIIGPERVSRSDWVAISAIPEGASYFEGDSFGIIFEFEDDHVTRLQLVAEDGKVDEVGQVFLDPARPVTMAGSTSLPSGAITYIYGS